jgi:methylase of polypeptide subunit release factors
LSLARENATWLGLDVDLREGDESAAEEGWDLVVSNPPYVDSLEGLQPELQHEPEVALVGVDVHRRIVERADARAIVFEVGLGQADEVAECLRPRYPVVTVTRDLTGVERVVEGVR